MEDQTCGVDVHWAHEDQTEVMKLMAEPSPSTSLILIEVMKLMAGPSPSASLVLIEK